MAASGRKTRASKSSAPEKQGASPRITTSPTDRSVVENLQEIADKNHRSLGREALIAVQSYIVATQSKP